MKPMLLAFVAIGLISVGANQALMRAGFSSGEQQSAPSVRLD